MKAQIIKSTEPTLNNQVMIIGPKKDVKEWWTTIALCILTRIEYCQDHGYKQTAKDLREMFEEIEEQMQEGD